MTIDLFNKDSTSSYIMFQLPIALSVSHLNILMLMADVEKFLHRIQKTPVILGPGSRVLMISERIGSSLTQCGKVLRSDGCVFLKNSGVKMI